MKHVADKGRARTASRLFMTRALSHTHPRERPHTFAQNRDQFSKSTISAVSVCELDEIYAQKSHRPLHTGRRPLIFFGISRYTASHRRPRYQPQPALGALHRAPWACHTVHSTRRSPRRRAFCDHRSLCAAPTPSSVPRRAAALCFAATRPGRDGRAAPCPELRLKPMPMLPWQAQLYTVGRIV